MAGVASFQGPTQRAPIATTPPLQVTPAGRPAVVHPSRNTAAPIGSHATAYLDALERENILVVDIPTLLLVADSVCARQGDTDVPAQAERLTEAFPGRWRPEQAAIIVNYAIKFVCGDTALRGTEVSADINPAER
ncbi:MAG: DUF732 domain-containing protein [Pseudonocardiaceae bacterium]